MSGDLHPGYSPNDVRNAPRRRSSLWSLIGLGRSVAPQQQPSQLGSPQTYRVTPPPQQSVGYPSPQLQYQQQQQAAMQAHQQQQMQQQQMQQQQMQMQMQQERSRQEYQQAAMMHAQQVQAQQQQQQAIQQHQQQQQLQYMQHQQLAQQQQFQLQQQQRLQQQQQQQQMMAQQQSRSQANEGTIYLPTTAPQHPLTPMGTTQLARQPSGSTILIQQPPPASRPAPAFAYQTGGEPARPSSAQAALVPAVKPAAVRRGKQEAVEPVPSPPPFDHDAPPMKLEESPSEPRRRLDRLFTGMQSATSASAPTRAPAEGSPVSMGVIRRPDLGLQIFPQSTMPRSTPLAPSSPATNGCCSHDHGHDHGHSHSPVSAPAGATAIAGAAMPASPTAEWLDQLNRQIQRDVSQRVQQQVQQSVNQSVQQHVQEHVDATQHRLATQLQSVMTIPASPEALRQDIERRLEVLDADVLSQVQFAFQGWLQAMQQMVQAQQTFFAIMPSVQFLQPPIEANRFVHSQHVISSAMDQFLASLQTTTMATLQELLVNGMPQLKQAADKYHETFNVFNQLKAEFYPAVTREPSRKNELQTALQMASQQYAAASGNVLRLLQALETKKSLAFGESLQQMMEPLAMHLKRAAVLMMAGDIPSPVHHSSETGSAQQSPQLEPEDRSAPQDPAAQRTRDLSKLHVANESEVKIIPPPDSSYHSPPAEAKTSTESGHAVPSTVVVAPLPAAAVDHDPASGSPTPLAPHMLRARSLGSPPLHHSREENPEASPPAMRSAKLSTPRRKFGQDGYPAGADVNARLGASPPGPYSPVNQSVA